MDNNFEKSLKKIIKYLEKAKNKEIFCKKEELPVLKQTMLVLKYILNQYCYLCIVPQAFKIAQENRIYNEKELKDIKKILLNLNLFDNRYTIKLIENKNVTIKKDLLI